MITRDLTHRWTKSLFLEKGRKVPRTVNRHEFLLSHNVENDCFWVDIFGFVVKLRPSAVTSFLAFFSTLEEDKSNGYNFFPSSQYFLTNFHNDAMPRSMFVSQNLLLSQTDAEVVSSNILPNNPPRFLIHLTITLGQFETELDLFNCASLSLAFKIARNLHDSPGETHLKQLMESYILQQLMFLPGGSHVFDRHCGQDWNILNRFFS